MLIGLISCSKAKTPYPAPARDLYSPSDLFKGALKNLSGRADAMYVLSAKYGLLPMDKIVEPYDQTLVNASPAERNIWAQGVLHALQQRHGSSLAGITFEIHAGMAYRAPLEALLRDAGAECSCPVEGLAMGQRLAFYAGMAAAKPADSGSVLAKKPAIIPVHLPEALRGLRGKNVTTGTGASFEVSQVTVTGITVVPERTLKPRTIRWREIEGAHVALLQRRSLTLAEVREAASEANPAYVFALLGCLPNVELIRDRPMKLVLRS